MIALPLVVGSVQETTTFDPLISVAGADGKKFVSIRHRVSTSKEGGKVSWLGGVLSGSGSEVTGGPYGTT